MLVPTADQIKAQLRWFIATFGGGFTGFVVGKGWISAAQMSALLDNEALLGIIAALIAGVWTAITHRKKNIVATVAAMPEVKAVQTTPTPEGRDLAQSVPAPNVTAARS